MKKYSNKCLNYCLSFFIPFLMILIYFLLNNTSFYDLFISDLRHQYIFLFDYLKDIFNGDASIFYSFSKGIGGNMYGTFFYYLSSPLNLFLLFFSKENLHVGIGLLIFIKIGLSGFTMTYYLDKQTKLSDFNKLLFSISYALMMYNITYYFCIMWLDIVILAPLVVLGLDRILENKKSKLYIFFLFLSIVANYYMAYMLCIFCVIYFIYKLLTMYNFKSDKKIVKKILMKFIIHSLLAGLLASIMILPTLNELTNVYRETYLSNNNSLLMNLQLLLRGIGLFNYNYGHRYYCCYFFSGFFVFSLFLNYLIFVKDKDKKYIISVLLVFIISILIPQLNYVWHCFTEPMLFQNRFCYLIPLFLIITLSQKMDKFAILTPGKIVVISVIYIAIMSISYIFDISNYSILIIVTNFFLLSANLYLIGINKKYNNLIYKFSLLFLTLLYPYLCLKYNFINSSHGNTKEDLLNYRLYLNDYFNNLDSNYYRLDGYNIIGLDELWNLKNGSRITYFISSNNKNIMNFYRNIGYNVSSTFASPDDEKHIVMNGLLGIKYWYNDNLDSENYVQYGTINIGDKEYGVYKSRYYKSIGYIVQNKQININDDNLFTYQNSFTKLLDDVEVYEECKVEKITNSKFQLKDDSCLNGYLYVNNYGGHIIIDNNHYSYVESNLQIVHNDYGHKNRYMKQYTFHYNSIVEIPYGDKYDYNLKIYKLNKSSVEKLFSDLDEELVIENVKKNLLEGNIKLKNDGTLLITFPYDRGFELYVDGVKSDYYEIFDTFVGIDLKSGEHTIKLIYQTPYLKIGIIFSLISLLITIIYFMNIKFDRKSVKSIKKI